MSRTAKPRITPADLRRARGPGGAWELGNEALAMNDAARAEAFVRYMEPSDQKMFCGRIVACWFRTAIARADSYRMQIK